MSKTKYNLPFFIVSLFFFVLASSGQTPTAEGNGLTQHDSANIVDEAISGATNGRIDGHHTDALNPEHGAESHGETDKFDAGKMILEHVADDHGWHLWGHTTVPLPCIVYTEKGLDVFSSARFNHGHDAYTTDKNTYKLHEGHIEIVNADGTTNEEASHQLWDFSITKNVVAMLVSCILMLWIFLSIAKSYKTRKGKAPKGLQSFLEPIIMFIRDDVAKASIGPKYKPFMPFLLTVFFFIFINNLMGLIPFMPGGANVTGAISVCIVLAGLVLIITLVKGNKHYWHHIVAMPGVPWPVLIILTPIELIGVVLRPFVLMIRLFANITAGHIIALSFFSLIFIFGETSTGAGLGVAVVALVFTVFMGALELLVAFLQAYVFTLLSSIYFGAAVEEGHHDDNNEWVL
jgi:F-type H+-transporting ATPase subunit a